eukprot:SAG22_NODE_2620_length_2368_cov_14.823711_1_plen_540_part_10
MNAVARQREMPKGAGVFGCCTTQAAQQQPPVPRAQARVSARDTDKPRTVKIDGLDINLDDMSISVLRRLAQTVGVDDDSLDDALDDDQPKEGLIELVQAAAAVPTCEDGDVDKVHHHLALLHRQHSHREITEEHSEQIAAARAVHGDEGPAMPASAPKGFHFFTPPEKKTRSVARRDTLLTFLPLIKANSMVVRFGVDKSWVPIGTLADFGHLLATHSAGPGSGGGSRGTGGGSRGGSRGGSGDIPMPDSAPHGFFYANPSSSAPATVQTVSQLQQHAVELSSKTMINRIKVDSEWVPITSAPDFAALCGACGGAAAPAASWASTPVSAPAAPAPAPARKTQKIRLAKGCWVMVKSSKGVDRKCQVVDLDGKSSQVLVHYAGFDSNFDEWVSVTSGRLGAPCSSEEEEEEEEDEDEEEEAAEAAAEEEEEEEGFGTDESSSSSSSAVSYRSGGRGGSTMRRQTSRSRSRSKSGSRSRSRDRSRSRSSKRGKGKDGKGKIGKGKVGKGKVGKGKAAAASFSAVTTSNSRADSSSCFPLISS